MDTKSYKKNIDSARRVTYRLTRLKGILREKMTGGSTVMQGATNQFGTLDYGHWQQLIGKALDKFVRDDASLAAEALVQLVSSLCQEGGSKPEVLKQIDSEKDELLPLPPRAFPEPKGREMNE